MCHVSALTHVLHRLRKCGDLKTFMHQLKCCLLHQLIRLLRALAELKRGFGAWLAATDSAKEGQFVSANDGKPLGYQNWNRNEPNNWGRGEDCAMMMRRDGKWNDLFCDYRIPPLCEKD